MTSVTYGEKLVDALLRKLTKSRKDYYYIAEPVIYAENSAHCHPDFVILSDKMGVIVLEVKDWIKILEADQRKITIQRRDGTKATETNPARTAREYALNLEEAFKKIDDLVTRHRGKTKLKFPWVHAVAFPNIESQIVRRLADQNIWGNDGYAFGREELTEARFEACLDEIRPVWTLTRPLNNEIREAVRAVLDPKIILPDGAGIETLKQTAIIREPLKIPQIEPGTRQPFLLADDFLTEEASELAENMTVRLIRGVAGSGKSLVLLGALNFWQNNTRTCAFWSWHLTRTSHGTWNNVFLVRLILKSNIFTVFVALSSVADSHQIPRLFPSTAGSKTT